MCVAQDAATPRPTGKLSIQSVPNTTTSSRSTTSTCASLTEVLDINVVNGKASTYLLLTEKITEVMGADIRPTSRGKPRLIIKDAASALAMDTAVFIALSLTDQSIAIAKRLFGKMIPDTPIMPGMFDTPAQATITLDYILGRV